MGITVIAAPFLALVLFMLVNKIGEHATEFGYASSALFEEPNESLAFNFFIRALTPSVFMVALSAMAVAAGHADLRIGSYWIAIFYYIIRAAFILLMNMQKLVSWPRFAVHAGVGLAVAWLTYQALIIPNRSLLPDLDTAGNELWLAIFAFLYAVANKVKTSGNPGDRRRNAFVQESYARAERLYGSIIRKTTSDSTLQLTIYSVLIYEDYCRPPVIRTLERLWFWKKERTTGVMQVASAEPLTDEESVKQGTDKLYAAWQVHSGGRPWEQVQATILSHNLDSNYLNNVMKVMEILAKRGAPQFRSAYEAIWNSPDPSDFQDH